MEEYNYCKYCKKNKDIKEFYKCNSSLCKDCKKYISKIYRDKNKNQDKYINNIELLNQKMNSIEILLKDLYKNTKYIEESIKTINPDIYFKEMENIIDKINIRNLKIDESINTIIKYNRKDIKLDDDYERELKEILED